MSTSLSIPNSDGGSLVVTIEPGQALFVLGVNGSGKSALMQRFYASNRSNAKRIAAHRTNYFNTENISLSSHDKRSNETNMGNQDTQPNSRWKDDYAHVRPNLAVYEMVDSLNVRARAIADAVDRGDVGLAKKLAATEAPLSILNRLLKMANVPVVVSVANDGQVFAVRDGGAPYSITRLSDGERNALLLACDLLTAKPGTLMLIDEPERHLHHSIINPLPTQFLSERDDLAFVICSHDISLPAAAVNSRTLLVRNCSFASDQAVSWDCDLIEYGADVPDDVKADILGGRRKLLFVEGTSDSLDKPLYALLFPMISVVPKSSCGDVERSVRGVRESNDLHWLQAWGLVDGDRQSTADIEALKRVGVLCVPYYSVESLYYHVEMQTRVSERLKEVVGGDPAERLKEARHGLLGCFTKSAAHMATRAIEKALRQEIQHKIPGQKAIASGAAVQISIDVSARLASTQTKLTAAIESGDVEGLLKGYSIRETGALQAIAKSLGFAGTEQYEKAVLKMLADDPTALEAMRKLLSEAAVAIA